MWKVLPLSVVGAVLLSACTPTPTFPGGNPGDVVRMQVCLPDRQSTATETVFDVTDVPNGLDQADWLALIERVRLTGKFERSARPRELVALRDFEPAANRPAPGFLSMGDVSRSDRVASTGGGGRRQDEITVTGQPVYSTAFFRRPGELLAAWVIQEEVEFEGSVQSVQLWYLPPRHIPREGWTDWIPAVRQGALYRDMKTESLLWAGQPVPRTPVATNAARVRFTTVGAQAYWRLADPIHRARRSEELGKAGGFEAQVAGPRPATAAVPGC